MLAENRKKQIELNKIYFIQKHGVKIGDIVEWIDGEKLCKGIISEIEFSGTTPTYYKAILFNSDGKIGKKEIRIYRYESAKVIS